MRRLNVLGFMLLFGALVISTGTLAGDLNAAHAADAHSTTTYATHAHVAHARFDDDDDNDSYKKHEERRDPDEQDQKQHHKQKQKDEQHQKQKQQLKSAQNQKAEQKVKIAITNNVTNPIDPSGAGEGFGMVSSSTAPTSIAIASGSNRSTATTNVAPPGLTLPQGNYIVNATIPVLFHTSSAVVECFLVATNGAILTNGAVTSATSPSASGRQTLPLTDLVRVTSSIATIDAQCVLSKTKRNGPQSVSIIGVSITADRKHTINGA